MVKYILLATAWLLLAHPISAQQLENLERELRDQQAPAREKIPGQPETRQPGYLGALGDETPAGLGVQIVQVFRGGPADRAGLKPGDIIIAIDGQPIHTLADMASFITGSFAGTNLKVQISRKREESTLRVVLGIRPAPPTPVAPPPPPLPDDARLVLRSPEQSVPENLEAKIRILEAQIRDLIRRLEALERTLELKSGSSDRDASKSDFKTSKDRGSRPEAVGD